MAISDPQTMEIEDPQAAEETAAPTSPTVTKMEAPEEESPLGDADAVMKTEPQQAQSTPQEEFTLKPDADLHKVKRGRVTKMEYRKMSLAERKEEKKLFVQSRLRRMIAPKPPCQILVLFSSQSSKPLIEMNCRKSWLGHSTFSTIRSALSSVRTPRASPR